MAHEEAPLNDIRAILGNDVGIKAYREGKLPFPDGTIIARIAWSYDQSEENNRLFCTLVPTTCGRPQSFVAGPQRTGFSLWSRTRENTHRPAAGGTLNSTTANLPTRHCSRFAIPATRLSKLATSSSLITHLDESFLETRRPLRGVGTAATVE